MSELTFEDELNAGSRSSFTKFPQKLKGKSYGFRLI
jgi:hypothetical protein